MITFNIDTELFDSTFTVNVAHSWYCLLAAQVILSTVCWVSSVKVHMPRFTASSRKEVDQSRKTAKLSRFIPLHLWLRLCSSCTFLLLVKLTLLYLIWRRFDILMCSLSGGSLDVRRTCMLRQVTHSVAVSCW